MKKAILSALLAVSALSLNGCFSESNADGIRIGIDAPNVEVTLPNPESQFHILTSGSIALNFGKRITTLTNLTDFESALTTYGIYGGLSIETQQQPVANSYITQTGNVLLVDLGKGHSGYEIKVDSVDVFSDHVQANITTIKPGQNCVTTQDTNGPFSFIYIPSKKDILIVEKFVIKDCTV